MTRGRFYEVKKILTNGTLELNGGISFAPGHATVSPGYAVPVNSVVTALRVDDVILSSSGPGLKRAGGHAVFATAMKSAKESVSVYTDSRPSLLKVLEDTKPRPVASKQANANLRPDLPLVQTPAETPSNAQPIKRPKSIPEPAAKGHSTSLPGHAR